MTWNSSLIEHLTDDERAFLDKARNLDSEACKRIVECPGWRWLRRSTLKTRRQATARIYGATRDLLAEGVRDRLLIAAARRS